MRVLLLAVSLVLLLAFPACADQLYSDLAAVLMYHGINESEGGHNISPARFAEHLDTLSQAGYNFISLTDMQGFLQDGKLPDNAVLVTFDDGYRNFMLAYQELKQRRIPAAMFIINAMVGQNPWGTTYLSWEDMQDMQDLVRFQSHSYNSHSYRNVAPWSKREVPLLSGPVLLANGTRQETRQEFLTRIWQDLPISKLEIETKLDEQVSFLSLPYGWGCEDTTYAARLMGMPYIFGIKPGLVGHRTSRAMLPRFNAGLSSLSGKDLDRLIRAYIPVR